MIAKSSIPFAFFATVGSLLYCDGVAANDLSILRYNNPGLTVDLEVGLWAWPVPCDADGDGDFDLMVSCPDKPHNGVYLFESVSGDTATHPMPVFKPGKFISKTFHYVMPSYVDGVLRVLTPGAEHPNFMKTGLEEKTQLSIAANWYKPQGKHSKGPKTRHNQWRYVDYDGDGLLDIVVGIEDWSFYGWDDAWSADGKWINGPLHGFVFVFRNVGSQGAPQYDEPFQIPQVDTYGCPTPNFEDFDGDGDLDLLCGEFLDGFTYFENIGTRSQPNYAEARRVTDGAGQDVRMDLQMIVPIAFDWDRDGDMDLICGDEHGRVAFIENTNKLALNRVPQFNQPRYFQQEAQDINFRALVPPCGTDWDGDGDIDLIVGNTAGHIGLIENLSGPGVESPTWCAPQKLQADSEMIRVMAGENRSIQGPAEAKWGYTTQTVGDWDGDGLPDIVANSILGQVVWYKNIGCL